MSPDSGTTTRGFDAAGNVLSSTDGRGLKTSYKYDALNRRAEALYADGRAVTWQYDQGLYGVGHPTAMTDSSGETSWSYDQHGHLLAEHQTIGGKTLTSAMNYDAAGRLAGMTYPSGGAISVSYDAAGRVSGLKSGTTALVGGVGYLPFGPAAGWTQGNGAVYSRNFDQDGRIAGIGLGNGAMSFAYDAASRITGIGETGFAAKSFAYDALDRLTGYVSGPTAFSYHYDADGNRTTITGSTTLSYGVAAGSNRLTAAGTRGFTYDADGDVTLDDRGVTILGYSYDSSGRLVAAKTGAYTTEYTNDGLGRRATRSGYGALGIAGDLERFLYDPAGHLLGEYDGNGKAIEETVWLPDPGSGPGQALPVAVLIPGKPPYSIAPDQLGSPHQIASATRAIVWHWDHDPFGNGAPAGSLTYNPRFPGQYYDNETGLHYNGLRDYDPTTGRYTESDPIGLLGGINSYAYVGGNPIQRVDAAGLSDTEATWETLIEYLSSVAEEGKGLALSACSKLQGEAAGFLQSLGPPAKVVTSNPQATSNAAQETLNPVGYQQGIQAWYATHTSPPPEIVQGQQTGYSQF